MNTETDNSDDYRSLLLLDEISKNDEITQRDMSRKLGVALGLVNSYLKHLISKGHITISGIPRKRYKYYLTPKGFIEKTRLTYHHLQNFTNLYSVARKDFSTLFRSVKNDFTFNKIVFCGVDEIAEIAYLSLNEVGLELSAVIDDGRAGKKFFGHTIIPFEAFTPDRFDMVVITSFKDGRKLATRLVNIGVKEEMICDISRGGWLKRVGGK